MINLFLNSIQAKQGGGRIIEEIPNAPIVVYKDIQDKINNSLPIQLFRLHYNLEACLQVLLHRRTKLQ